MSRVSVTRRLGGAPPRPDRVLLGAALLMLMVSVLVGAGVGIGEGAGGDPASGAHLHIGSVGWGTLALLGLAPLILGPNGQDGEREARSGALMRRLSSLFTIGGAVVFLAANVADRPSVEGGAATAMLAGVSAYTGSILWWHRTRWTTPALATGAAIALLLAGGVVAVFDAARAAADTPALTSGGVARHAAVLSAPYVVLIVSAVVEWALGDDDSRTPTTAGTVQVGLAVLSGLLLLVGTVAGHLALIEANVALLVASVVVFFGRVAPRVFASGWWRRDERVWLGVSTACLAADTGLFLHVLAQVGARRYSTIELVPEWVVFAVDHVTFGAVMTAALVGAIVSGITEWPRRARWVSRAAAMVLPAGVLVATAGIGFDADAVANAGFVLFGGAMLLAAAVATLRLRTPT